MALREVKVGMYTGSKIPDYFARQPNLIENTLLTPFSFDAQLTDIAKQLPMGTDFSVLDVGSGAGVFLRTLTDHHYLPQFTQTLEQRKLRIVGLGLTDCENKDLFNQPDPATSFSSTNGQFRFEIRNYFYTITAAQTIKKFLEDKRVGKFHFINASHFFLYQSARMLGKTMDTLIEQLDERGKLLAVGMGITNASLPAFRYIPGRKIDEAYGTIRDLRLFWVPEYRAPCSIPALTLASEWKDIKERLVPVIEKYRKGQSITEEAVDKQVFQLLCNFRQIRHGRLRILIKRGFTKQFETDPENLLSVDDAEAKIAFGFYTLIFPMLQKIRQHHFLTQHTYKQTYYEGLLQRPEITVIRLESVLNSMDTTLDAVLIQKREAYADSIPTEQLPGVWW